MITFINIKFFDYIYKYKNYKSIRLVNKKMSYRETRVK